MPNTIEYNIGDCTNQIVYKVLITEPPVRGSPNEKEDFQLTDRGIDNFRKYIYAVCPTIFSPQEDGKAQGRGSPFHKEGPMQTKALESGFSHCGPHTGNEEVKQVRGYKGIMCIHKNFCRGGVTF